VADLIDVRRRRVSEDLILSGTVVTMGEDQADAEALAIASERIVAVGSVAELKAAYPGFRVIDLEGHAILPGFVEAHGHPLTDALVTSGTLFDIRPVTIADADDVVAALQAAVATSSDVGIYATGWDPLLQKGLPAIDRDVLDSWSPDKPLVILHNSGHSVFFNSAAMSAAGIPDDAQDPPASSWERRPDGTLSGVGYESGAVFGMAGPALGAAGDITALLAAEFEALAARGMTTVSEMAMDPRQRDGILNAFAAHPMKLRLRLYEMSGPHKSSSISPDNGDDMVKQIGIKTWSDGSPWVGNIATSFPYLDTEGSRSIGLEAGHRGEANYTREQLDEVFEAYYAAGWQISSHSHGDLAITMVLDAIEAVISKHPERDHRLRLEHCGAMQPEQFVRAAALGVTCSLFPDHIYYWGDVLEDELFGAEHGNAWVAAGSALRAGVRISFHNDSPVTPEEPLRNISAAVTRKSRSGRVHGEGERVTVEQALRAETIDAAYQIFADDIIGSLEVGKYADLVVLGADPRSVDPDDIPDIPIIATFLAGRQTHGDAL
jgi:predicted amidohydrolase YtcJ